jgi:hypothetical protein
LQSPPYTHALLLAVVVLVVVDQKEVAVCCEEEEDDVNSTELNEEDVEACSEALVLAHTAAEDVRVLLGTTSKMSVTE